jgi:hypothetical protein
LHVLKFLTSIFFSRKNEEHGFPLGGGNNGKSWLLFLMERVLGEYATGIQAGVLSNPVPSPRAPNPDWLDLMGRKVFLGGEKGMDLMIDAGTFKALRDPTNAISLRGLYEGIVKFRSAGRLIIPDNSKVTFKGGVDGGVKRSILAWPHPWTFCLHPTAGTDEKQARDIKTKDYCDQIIRGLLVLFIEIDNAFSKEWICGQILPQPVAVKESISSMLTQRLDSNLEAFLEKYCEETPDYKLGSTPADLMKEMKLRDYTLNGERDLESLLRSRWFFVNPHNRHRVKKARNIPMYIKLKPIMSLYD